MKTAINIFNKAKEPAVRRCVFKALLDELDRQYSDLLLHTEARWVSRGRFATFSRFSSSHIRIFGRKGGSFRELEDPVLAERFWFSCRHN